MKVYLDKSLEQMNAIKEEFLNPELHKESNCFGLLIIAHGTEKREIKECSERGSTEENQGDSDSAEEHSTRRKTFWDSDLLEHEIGQIKTLEARPKIIIFETCRGRKNCLW